MPRLYRVTRLSWNHYVLEITVQDTICKFVTAFKFASRNLRRNSSVHLADSPHSDPAAFVRYIRREEPARHKALCEARAAPWGSEPLEPLAKCVENLVLYIVQTIEEQAVGGLGHEEDKGEVGSSKVLKYL